MAEDTADATNAAKEPETDAGESGKSKKKTLLIVIAAALFVAGGGGAAAFLLLSPSHESPPASEHGEEAAAAAETTHGDNAAEEANPADAADTAHGDEKPAPEHGESAAEDKHAASDPAAKKETEAPGVDFGTTYTFKTFHLNLGNPLENHYIRLEIAVEFKGGNEQLKEIEQRVPQLRDAVVSVTSRKTREFLLGPDGKDQLRREILIRMNRYMSRPLESVFLTDILIE